MNKPKGFGGNLKKFVIIFLTVLTGISEAQFKKVGRTAMQFVKIGVGARETAMGEATIANLNDVNAVFWNPAALTRIENLNAAFHYNKWIADLNVMSAAGAARIGNLGVLAVDYVYLNYGNLQEATVTSASGSIDTRTGKSFSGKDLAVGLAFARAFTDKLSIGVNVRYLREDLYKYNSSLWSFDIGSFYDTGWKGIRLAMSAQNFTTQARWLQSGDEAAQSFELPLLFRLGISMDVFGGEDLFLGGTPDLHKFSINVDALHTNDYTERLNIGAEYIFLNQFALRGGYRFNYDEGNLSLGVGFHTQLTGLNLNLDYSYVKFDFLESPHRFSVAIAF